MDEAFDVFFHQRAIPDYLGKTIFEEKSADKLLVSCEAIYAEATGDSLTLLEKEELTEQLRDSQKNRNYLEIQFFQVELDEEALLEELQELFPQFIWTKMSEEIEDEFSTYACEFIPLAIQGENQAVYFSLKTSLEQMTGSARQSISEMVEKHLHEILSEEAVEDNQPEELSFPVSVTIEPSKEESKTKQTKAEPSEELFPEVKNVNETSMVRSEENELVYLKESLKREKASKERVRVAKEKLEHELLAIENSLLVSGLKRFKKHRKITVDEEDWYKSVKIDLIHYDDLYKKAKFIEQSWKLNKELVTITEKMTVTKGELTYERERVERIKNSVSEMDLQSMMEQCHLINNRVRINRGFWFIKPSVKLYQIDYEQLEKISGFFDVIQTENRLLEQIILKSES
ncbi:hypothetical protein ACYSNR_08885 [Enterococcus sp. LJL128]|uniref:hypothetical protein n=1 Tax=Enterococcus sp. LJL51 TaxID=3416656 RepID=UPI003CEA8A37